MRSLARARSSSRRAPPSAASKPCSAMASSSVTVCRRLRDAPGPLSSTTRPRSIESWTEATISRSPSSATRRAGNSMTWGKLWPVSTWRIGKGKRAGRNAFSASRSSTIESLPPLNSSTGRSNSAATSRMTKTASASRTRRYESSRSMPPSYPTRSDLSSMRSELAHGALGDRVDDEDRLVGAGVGELLQPGGEASARQGCHPGLDRSLARPVQANEHARAALHRRLDARTERGEALGRVAVVDVPGVPGVDVRQRDREHARAVGADHQRDAARGGRQQHGVVGTEVLARERDALGGEQAADDRERLLEA